MSKAPFDHQAIRSVVGEYRDPKQSIEERGKQAATNLKAG